MMARFNSQDVCILQDSEVLGEQAQFITTHTVEEKFTDRFAIYLNWIKF